MNIGKQTAPLALALLLASCSNAPTSDSSAPDAEKGTSAATAAGTPAASVGSASASKGAESKASDAKTSAAGTGTPKPSATKELITVPSTTTLHVVLTDALSSGKNKAGDEFTGSLREPVLIKGATVLPKGTMVHGKVVSAEGSGRVKGLANMKITLTAVMLNDKMIPVSTKPIAEEAQETKKRDAGIIGGAAGIGAAVGAIAGGGKGALTGAVLGGGAGTGAVLGTKGKEVEFPSESKLEFALDKDLTVN